MGFFDMIKEGAKVLTEQVTGSYGKIDFRIEPERVMRGDNIHYMIHIEAVGELKAKSVFLRLLDNETCRMTIKVRDFSGHMSPKEFTQSKTLYDTRQEVCGNLELSEGETKNLVGEIAIPTDIQPTYRGFFAQHTWNLEVVLDAPRGKDLTKRKELFVI